EVAEATFKAFYDTVFIYRYRDVQPAIRSECIVPLATWCRAFPAGYLDTEYLRYLGWALNDKDARVRETALAAIGGPLLLGKQPTHGGVGSGVGAPGASASSEDSVAEGIRPFIGRFLPRIVQVAAGDIDVKVQVAALKLVALLGKHQFLDPTAKIGDIRNIKKTECPGKSSKKKKTSRSRGTYSNSLSQQLLEESSSEEEEEEEADVDMDDANMLDIQTLYGDGSADSAADEAGQLECPRHTTMQYLAPLVAHTQAAVRGAAAELVAWWIREDWARAARVSALGVDRALAHSQTPSDDDGEEESDDDVDSDASASDLLASARGRKRVHKWAVFKALAAFLAHLTRGDRQPHQTASLDADEQRVWVAELSASLVEEVWAGADTPSGRATGLDALISAAAEEGQAPGRLVAAASALWSRVPELDSLSTLAGYLSRDHSATRRAFALSPSEETALLQAFASWVHESATVEKSRRARPAQPDSRWQTSLPRLLARNGEHAPRVAALAVAASVVDIQALFDADRSDVVEAIAQHLSSALERHATCVRVIRPAAAFLARVDRSAVLHAPWCLPAAESASDPARISALRGLVRAADVSSAIRVESLLALTSAEESVALSALDSALHAMMWRAVSANQQAGEGVGQLEADRDLMLRCCLELTDPSASDRRRLRELAFVALGRTLRVFTGALVHSETGRGLALNAATVAEIRARLAAFFEQRVNDWIRVRDSDQWRDVPSALLIAYARVCAMAATWASWLGDQTLLPSALSRLAAFTGLAGMERRSETPVRRRVGFVALSAVDHIIQAGVDALKPQIAKERTRGQAIEALGASLRSAFEMDGDAVNVATLARFVGSALRTAGDLTLAPAPVGAAW
ncbi:cohesin complex subunit, partial [Coemansia sp. RSA 2611]